jgi:transposase-like protein
MPAIVFNPIEKRCQLKSYGAAKREILPGVEYRQSRDLNNRCENSHRPTRQWERRALITAPATLSPFRLSQRSSRRTERRWRYLDGSQNGGEH